MLDKSFIPDIDFGKNCIHCIAVNFCPIFPCIFPGLDINIEVKFKSIVK